MDKSPRSLAQARALRRGQTPAEAKLWGYLRNSRLNGFKFRRQVPVPPYIVDFLCLSHMLIVELDGVTHSNDQELRYDQTRTEFLKSKGFEVIRIWNDDVYRSMDNVMHGILIALNERGGR